MPDALAALALGNFRDRSATDDRQRLVLENVGVIGIAGFVVLGLDQEPRLFFLSASAVHAHEMPPPAQFLALEREDQVPLLVSAMRVAIGLPTAAVPDHHGAAAILPLRNGPFECVVFDRMIFHVDRKAFVARNKARTTGNRPALHHAVEFEPQVVMQAARRVLLYDELIAFRTRGAPARLRGDVKLALLTICLKAHRQRPLADPAAGAHRGKQDKGTRHEREFEVPLPFARGAMTQLDSPWGWEKRRSRAASSAPASQKTPTALSTSPCSLFDPGPHAG